MASIGSVCIHVAWMPRKMQHLLSISVREVINHLLFILGQFMGYTYHNNTVYSWGSKGHFVVYFAAASDLLEHWELQYSCGNSGRPQV